MKHARMHAHTRAHRYYLHFLFFVTHNTYFTSQDHPRNVLPDLCRKFYSLGWMSGTGGALGMKVGYVHHLANINRLYLLSGIFSILKVFLTVYTFYQHLPLSKYVINTQLVKIFNMNTNTLHVAKQSLTDLKMADEFVLCFLYAYFFVAIDAFVSLCTKMLRCI